MFILGFVIAAILVLAITYLMGKKNLYVYSSVEILDITQKEIFDFITNIANDDKWYDGVKNTEVIIEGAADLSGRRYIQNGEFNGVPFKNDIEFMKTNVASDSMFISFVGRGFALNYTAYYMFEPTANGTRFTNISTVSNARFGYLFSGITALWQDEPAAEQISTYLAAAQIRLAEALNKTTAEKSVKAAVISR